MTRYEPAENDVLYRRTLPGGGFVIIRAEKVAPLVGRSYYRGEVVIERRTELVRRDGHSPPVVLRYDGPSLPAVMHELFPVAHSNAALAVACMTRRPRRSAGTRALASA